MPDFVIPIGRFHFALHDRVGFAQNRQPLGRDLAENAHGESRTGERLAINDFFRQTELQSGLPHFVFEQLAHRFDELEMHFFRQPADVVMALDHVRGIAADRDALDHVGVKRALREKLDSRRVRGRSTSRSSVEQFLSRVFKYADEFVADNFSFRPPDRSRLRAVSRKRSDASTYLSWT